MSATRNIPRWAAVLVAAALVAPSTGCGGDDDTTPKTEEEIAQERADAEKQAASDEAKEIDRVGWRLGQKQSKHGQSQNPICAGATLIVESENHYSTIILPPDQIANCYDGDPELSPEEARINVAFRERATQQGEQILGRELVPSSNSSTTTTTP